MNASKKWKACTLATICLLLSLLLSANYASAEDEVSGSEEIAEMVGIYLDWVDTCDIELTGWDSTARAGFSFIKFRNSGYYKMELSALYADKGNSEFRWIDASVTTGNTTLFTPINCEIGLDVILGTGEEEETSADVGAVGFSGELNYTIPEYLTILPVEVSARLIYSPESLSFWNVDEYLAYQFGLDVPFNKTASILIQYAFYDIDLENDRDDLDADVFQLGLAFHF